MGCESNNRLTAYCNCKYIRNVFQGDKFNHKLKVNLKPRRTETGLHKSVIKMYPTIETDGSCYYCGYSCVFAKGDLEENWVAPRGKSDRTLERLENNDTCLGNPLENEVWL